ncbi:MAG: DNA mismatch repair protein MutS [Crocinitomicaceae bacterium]
MNFDNQSISDLEFDVICNRLSNYCKSKKAEQNAVRLKKLNSIEDVKKELNLLNEIAQIHAADDLSMPHPASDSIDGALKLLHINNGVLTLDELLRVYTLCLGTQRLIQFTSSQQHNFPLIYQACEHISEVDSILKMIQEILNDKNEIKDDATATLAQIRKQQTSNKREINKNFEKALKKGKKDEVLADTLETYLDHKRLLAVISGFRGNVNGKVVSTSAKGNIAYIEPESNLRLNEHQAQLRNEERSEVFKILSQLTDKLRSRKKDLEAFQRLLVRFDLYNAKVLFANTYNGIAPKINEEAIFDWTDAKHPLLFLSNKSSNQNTIGQDISMSRNKRFFVISGPNAGGKSITLKTIGLVQMMFQSGLFVPLGENSSCCWFEDILSDIGDNQSIENQLSTYSYRLQRMKLFLDKSDQDTLLLLDEFGSGSDPELGGALAEVFYEQLYDKECFAVITTHYANIKILTAKLDNATNACMLFDTEKLTPLYKLSVGQPGSSFTFEVASLNGIPSELIAAAKSKVSDTKLKVDELTVALQKEKSEFKSINEQNLKSTAAAEASKTSYDQKLLRLSEKAEKQAAFFEQQNKYLNAGKRLFELIKKYEKQETNKALNESVKRYVAQEKSKILALKKAQKEAAKKRKIKEQVKIKPALLMDEELKAPNLPKVKKSKKEQIASTPIKETKKDFKAGDMATLKSTGQKGNIKEINGNKVSVLVGNFVITTKLSEIE